MPNHYTHDLVTKNFFGPEIASRFYWVHSELDRTASTTGPTHRGDSVHSEEWVALQASYYYDSVRDGPWENYVAWARAVAKLHIQTDQIGISYKESEAAEYLARQMVFGANPHYYAPPNQKQKPSKSLKKQVEDVDWAVKKAGKTAWSFKRLMRALSK